MIVVVFDNYVYKLITLTMVKIGLERKIEMQENQPEPQQQQQEQPEKPIFIRHPLASRSEEISLDTKGYRFVKKLGQGSYAKVYLGEFYRTVDPNKKPVDRSRLLVYLACKVIDTQKSPKEFLIKFLKREIAILLRIKHPHIITVHSLFQRKSKYYIFMR